MTTERRARVTGMHVLTALQVHNAKAGDPKGKNPPDLRDGGGLVLQFRGERASWYLKYTSPITRRQREQGLGIADLSSKKAAGASLTAARKAADASRALLALSIDPLDHAIELRQVAIEAEQAKKAAKKVEHWTLCRAARDYHERVIEPTKTTKHAADWINSLENHLPPSIWHKPIGDIEPPELLRALSGITAHKRARRVEQGSRISETTERIRQRLDAIYEDVIFNKLCTSNPAAAVLRKMQETLPRKKAGNLRALPYREEPALLARIKVAEGTAARCLEFAVLTAARTGEVLGAVWSEFDLDSGVWVVPAERMKASGKKHPEPHTVHLSARALSILRHQLGQHESIVFPSPMLDGRPLSNMAMLTALDRLNVRERTTVHGLCRSTFSTWANETGAARSDVIEACLAHREADRIRAAYNRAAFTEERRALLEAWAAYLDREPGQVVDIESRRVAAR